jgi:hypothetical protein
MGIQGLERFQKDFAEVASKVINTIMENHKSEFEEVFINHFLDFDGPTEVARDMSKDEKFFSKAFYGFGEITKSYDCINDACIYIRRFPYNDTNISRVRYLRYNIESYLNEMYILKNRLIAYLKVIERSYKSTTKEDEVKSIIAPLYSIVSESLKGIVNVRGGHVHGTRYSDKDLDRLETIELVTIGDYETYKNMFHNHYKGTRVKWVKTLKGNNEVVKKLLDFYFDELHRILFDDNGDLHYASKYS